MTVKSLAIFNLETNKDSKVLAPAHDWVIAFSQLAHEVYVYSTHVGRHEFPNHVKVKEIGGGSLKKRVKGLLKLYVSFFGLLKLRKDLIVFHHMSTRTVLLLGLFFRLAGIKQGLWYSHSKNSLSLRLSCRIVDTVFSSTPSSIPVHSRKIRYVGHGIRCKPFVDARKKAQKPRHGILVLGRIAKIKNIERAIQSISESEIENPELTCVGPVESNSTYHLDLLRFASQKHVKIVLEGPYEYSAIPLLLVKYDAIFTGTPKSVDKAAIEGALSGCFVITDQEETIELTGMREIWKLLGFPCSPNLIMQINLLSKMNAHDKLALRSVLSDKCAQLNNVDETVKKILKEIARVNDRH